MIYLLDVSALLALGVERHAFHARVASWLARQPASILATSSIVELGFVRILAQVPDYGYTLTGALELLSALKNSGVHEFRFFRDGNDASHLPAWVAHAPQITDGHLLRLATTHGAQLATLDQRIPGAYLIPG